MGYARGGVFIAARYAGLISSLSNVYAYLAAIIMPYIVGAMVTHGSVGEWRNSAFLVAGVLGASFIQFQIFGSAEPQKWAEEKSQNTAKIYVVREKKRNLSSDGEQPDAFSKH